MKDLPPEPTSTNVNHSRLRKIRRWCAQRDARYVGSRVSTLVRRYGISTSRARKRVFDCVEALARYGCRPTFPTPGQVVGRNGPFCRELQHRGAELAVHGYHHLDFRALSLEESRRQMAGAAAAYARNGIEFEGFRCPYLSCTEPLKDAITDGRFQYSSNEAIRWDAAHDSSRDLGPGGRAVFQALSRFYRAQPSTTHLSVPRIAGGLVEIPVCLPDDLQLLDGLQLDADGLRQAWVSVLHQTHQRGELFDLMFHPESFEQCGPALEAVLHEACRQTPPVWITQLREINRWWREKSGFSVTESGIGRGCRLTFNASARATILVRHLDAGERSRPWLDPYRWLESRTLELADETRPFIGIAEDVPAGVVAVLQNQGYIVDTSAQAPRCTLFLSPADLAGAPTPVQLLDLIERSPAPLVRFWRWPDAARSALCITGDLDALSLTDYAARVFAL